MAYPRDLLCAEMVDAPVRVRNVERVAAGGQPRVIMMMNQNFPAVARHYRELLKRMRPEQVADFLDNHARMLKVRSAGCKCRRQGRARSSVPEDAPA